ncbi:sugar phosphate isomerase/epimerase [Lipingzhangella sp. LS1_29]|uniref:Sugar phosphate isomerase/epimerase n=1 Tax=Lipingzhangella rawalii TaxID=2055835 RepID=A0ABU2HAS8_9ACTN|nr:sugar phosphate isomerase/epimerase [Lipingzhangella rawalii]MDS1272412.1 sugar phosphate isomerase/epimerase [Lipingzhangella rawalii]
MSDAWLDRLSVNQKTINSCTLPEAVRGCAAAGIPAIGLWREPVHQTGLRTTAALVRAAGLRVSSLCRGGFVTVAEDTAWWASIDDNRRAIDEAAELGAPCLVLVVGGLPSGSRDLRAARARVADALAELAPYAAQRGVRLALEPMHPMYCADRGVLSTLAQAVELAQEFPPDLVGVVVDTFHVWWDPEVDTQIARAGPRIASFQVSDWITPLPADVLLGRGLPGDGHIDFRALHAAVDAAGYAGDVEVEVFNAEVWREEPHTVLRRVAERYRTAVLGGPA